VGCACGMIGYLLVRHSYRKLKFAMHYHRDLLTVVFLMLYLGLTKMLGRWNWIIQETCPCGVVWITTLTLYSSGKMVNINKPC
jgi:hypothetical protein